MCAYQRLGNVSFLENFANAVNDRVTLYKFIALLKRIFSFALGLVASIKVILLNESSSEIFEGRTVTLGCVNNTINKTSTVWYKDGQVINNETAANLTLTLKSTDTGSYKCRINGMKSTNNINVTVKGMNL